MADAEKKEPVETTEDVKTEKPAKAKTAKAKESDTSFDVEKAKSFLMKDVVVKAPMWALILIGLLILAALLG